MTASTASNAGSLANEACPHLVFGNVLGKTMVAGLLDYVEARQAEFKPAVVRNRATGERRVDSDLRNSTTLGDLGPFKAPIETFVREIMPSLLAPLHLSNHALEPKEFCILSYPDGSVFKAHIDTNESVNRVRVLSCVYYFALTPRRFSGGELRIYGMPTLSAAKVGPLPFADVVPETDSLVVFPSWLRHEVLPVRVPSRVWLDGRFTVNCWLHRAA